MVRARMLALVFRMMPDNSLNTWHGVECEAKMEKKKLDAHHS